jgi:flagellar biosynthesis/type III secretory pathway protein FliH
VEENTDCDIHLNPEDCALLEEFNPKLLQGDSRFPRTRIHRTIDVSRGGCLVKTRLGIIDARRETKLALLEKSLLA